MKHFRSACSIAKSIALDIPETTSCLVICADGQAAHSIGLEKLSPIVGFIKFDEIGEAIALARAHLEREGLGHSIGIYSECPTTIARITEAVSVSRIMVNQSTGLGNTGRTTNGMSSSVTLSCGTWGGTNTNENITWKHFLNYTVVSHPLKAESANLKALFGRHWHEASASMTFQENDFHDEEAYDGCGQQ